MNAVPVARPSPHWGTAAGVLFALAVAAPASAATSILGTWRGTSTCTDRKFTPACKDEVVVYRFTAGVRDTVHQAAFKIVAGEEQPMGEMDFVPGKRAGTWVSEFHTARYHGRWTCQVADTLLTGTLVDVPTGKVVRRVRTVRERVRP